MEIAGAQTRAARTETDWAGYGAFAGASAIWGSTFLVIAFSDAVLAPLWGATLRLVVASLALAAIVIIRRVRFPRGAALRDVALYGTLQFGANFALLYWGEQSVPSGITAVVFATAPLQTALYSRAFGLEALDRVKLAAAALAVIGVLIIFAGQLGVGVPGSGLIAVALAASSAALGTVLLHRAGPQSTWAINAIGAPIGAVVCFAASLLLGEVRVIPQSFDQWWPVLYLAFLGSLGAFVLFSWLVGHWNATTASFAGVVVPVIALALGAAIRGERPPLASFVGAALVIIAVVVALRRARQIAAGSR